MPKEHVVKLPTGFPTGPVKTDWITPADHLASTRKVLGGKISLDVASDAIAQEYVKADRYFTASDNGLTQDWNGLRIWCNPPGSVRRGENTIGPWLDKMRREYTLDHFSSGIFLAFTVNTAAKWFQSVIGWFPICFASPRMSFLNSEGKPEGSPRHENLFVYMGPNPGLFAHVFSWHGEIVPPYKVGRPVVIVGK